MKKISIVLLVCLVFSCSSTVKMSQDELNDALRKSVQDSDFRMTEKYLKAGADPSHKYRSITILAIAMQHEAYDIIGLLVEYGLDPDTIVRQGSYCNVPLLMKSLFDNNPEAYKMLLEAGADIENATQRGSTPIIQAACQGQLDIVKELIAEGADVNAQSKINKTALIMAVINGHLEIVKLLVDAGADINQKGHAGLYNDPDASLKTPLEYAIQKGQSKIQAYLEQI